MGVPRKERGVERTHEIKPHFFTVIVSPSLQLLKMRIPKKFVRDHGKHLSNLAYLRVPNGADWPVEVTNCKGSVWLSRGWNQFAEYYSLAFGYLLVFRYDGSSRFRVSVFDTTAIEIDYSSNNLQQSANQSGEFRALKAERTNEDEEGIKDDTSTEMLDELQQQLEGKSSEERASQRQNSRAASKILSDAEARVKQRANAFQSRNPLFMFHIRERNLSGNAGPVFPVCHHRTYFKKRSGSKEIVLRIHEKTWHVQLRHEKFRPFCIALTFGWRDFVLNNDLKEGDICVFELIDSATKTYNVHVFRIERTEEDEEGTEDDTSVGMLDKLLGRKSSSQQQPEEDGLSANQKANAFHSQDPYFIVPMKRRHVHYKLGPVFPTSHCKEYFTKDDDKKDIVLRINKRTWYLKYRFEKLATFCIALSSGWKEFMADNDLEEGDECVFELIDSAQKAYNVHIFRDYEETSELTLRDAEIKEETMLDELQQQPEGKSREKLASQRRNNFLASRKILNDAKYKVQKSADAFKSRNPFFMVQMQKRNLSGNSGPILPTSHGRQYYTENDHNKYIALRVNEKTWHIKCRLEKFGSFCLALSIGWKMFVLNNSLQEGDICIFELIDSATKTYNTKLFRISEHKAKPNLIDEGFKDDIPIETSGRRGRSEKLATQCKTSRDPESVKERLLRKANAFMNGHPGFIIQMNKSYIVLDRTVHVPLSHSEKYLKDKGNDANVIVVYGKDKRAWKMKYRIEESYPRLSSPGWRKFRTDNALAIGDVCAFKLVKRTQKAYKVSIFRGNGK